MSFTQTFCELNFEMRSSVYCLKPKQFVIWTGVLRAWLSLFVAAGITSANMDLTSARNNGWYYMDIWPAKRGVLVVALKPLSCWTSSDRHSHLLPKNQKEATQKCEAAGSNSHAWWPPDFSKRNTEKKIENKTWKQEKSGRLTYHNVKHRRISSVFTYYDLWLIVQPSASWMSGQRLSYRPRNYPWKVVVYKP